jgi:GNAT superfamily N-acetyltransferase
MCFVAEYDGIPVGMGAFQIDNDVNIDLHPWCLGLWVRPEYRGNNIGRKLSLKRFAWARKLGYKKIYLDTVNAEGYHKKFGWKNTGLVGYYQGTPTIIMEYDL